MDIDFYVKIDVSVVTWTQQPKADRYCLMTSDVEKKGGCHNTKEGSVMGLSNIKIGTRLYAAFDIFLLILLGVGVLGVAKLCELDGIAQQMGDKDFKKADYTYQASSLKS